MPLSSCPHCGAPVSYWESEYGSHHQYVSNFTEIAEWMKSIGQGVPSEPVDISDPNIQDILLLRYELIREESDETLDALSNEDLTEIAKEAGDLMVVTYGTLAALGIDADQVMRIIADNNRKKVESGSFRGDGKLVVPQDVKQKLKEEVTTRIQQVVGDG